jgi:uncharacterized protein YbgA (DUF1722 family)/uncharacterized protein YbbK (DUF523 family)
MNKKIPVGVSACLLGEEVRFDGGHKRDRFLVDVLGEYFEWVPVCPEVAAGLGTPRETLRLVQSDRGDRMVGNRTGTDVTDRVEQASVSLLDRVAKSHLRGFILKKDSPSCGLERVRVYDGAGIPSRGGTGVFARLLLARQPNLPIEEEGRLNDPRIRENFITRVFCYDRWIRLLESGPAPRDVIEFHTRHKLILLAHSPAHYRKLGPLVARAGSMPIEELLAEYEAGLMAALANIASPGRHANVLEHLAGFLKDDLSRADKAELHRVIQEYRSSRVPLVAALILLYHHLKHLQHDWVEAQLYLQPYPTELALRSSI